MDGSDATSAPTDPASDALDHLQSQDASLFGLLRVMLSPKTLPHVVLLGGLTALLFFLARQDMADWSAVGFLALSGGYVLSALLSRFRTVRQWTELGPTSEEKSSAIRRLVVSFRICLFPLAMATVVALILNGLLGDGGALGLGFDHLPFILGSGFVLWAVIQGRSVGAWLAAVSASRLPEAKPRGDASTNASTVTSYSLLLGVSTLLLFAFDLLLGEASSFGSVNVPVLLFWGAFSVLFVASWKRTASQRNAAATSTNVHRFAQRWMLLTQALISWHLLTVWRHLTLENGAAQFIEELVLMVFTVVMAIWSLTSRSFKSSFRLIDESNALPFGLAFGYAYAGSVSMVTVQLDTDVQGVMVLGHGVVILTLLWLQPRVLSRVVAQHDALTTIQATVAALPSVNQPVEESAVDLSDMQPSTPPADSPSLVDGGSSSDAIGANVEWQAPEVLADSVAWADDDEVEVVD
jgi:hypothetical protein